MYRAPRSVIVATATLATFIPSTAVIPAVSAATLSARHLALSAADFPPGAKINLIANLSGPKGQIYQVTFNFRSHRTEEEVTDMVATSPTTAAAGSNYVSYAEQNSGFPGEAALRLPRYGDRESANWASYTDSDGARRARSAIVVIKGRTVWSLIVENCGVIAEFGCAFGPTPPGIRESQAVSELMKYALKQQRRIGGG